MEKITKYIFLLIFISVFGNAYSQWIVKHGDKNSWKGINAIKFYKDYLGIAVGDNIILKSTDTGNTWSVKLTSNKLIFTDVSIVDDSLMYLVCFYNDPNMWSALFKSTDGGEHWDSVSCLFDKQLYTICFINKDIGLVAGYNGIYRTEDGGITWKPVFVEAEPEKDIYEIHDLFIASDTMIYADGINYGISGGSFILKSNNFGQSWSKIILESFEYDLCCNYYLDKDYGYIVKFPDSIFRTKDGGIHWEGFQIHDLPPWDVVTSIYFTSPAVGYAVGGFFGPWLDDGTNPYDYFISKTIDSGKTWQTHHVKFGIPLTSVFFIDENTGFVGGVNGELIMKTYTGGGDTVIGDYPLGFKDQQVSEFSDFKVYPSCFNDKIIVETNSSLKENVNIRLINLYGKELLTTKLYPGETSKILETSALGKGFYFLEITGSREKKTIKLLKI